MAIEIKEYVGDFLNITESLAKGPISLKESSNEVGPISKESIIQLIEGIHVGPTRNFTWYTEEALISSIPSWTKPYQRPLIMHHNEKDGKIIGRIISVEHKAHNTRSNTPALLFTCNVPDKEGIEQIKDGRLKTVSIGVIAHDVRCSICGQQVEIIDEYGNTSCGHTRGESYDEQVCYWKIYKMEAKELSYVIVPSDIYAHNVETIPAEKFNNSLSENNKINKKGVSIDMAEQINEGKVKSQLIEEEVLNEVETANTEKEINKENKVEEKSTEEVKEEVDTNKEESTIDEKKEGESQEDLKKEIEKLTTEKEVVAEELDKLKADLDAANEKIKEVSDLLATKTEEVKTETALKEAVENELASVKLQMRESRENEFNTLRTTLNKSIVAKEALSARSDESLIDAIADLKEEMTTLSSLKKVEEALNPTIDIEKNKNNNVKNVKENKTVGNINVEEGLQDLFSNMFGPNYNY